jgi:hypothetical protein
LIHSGGCRVVANDRGVASIRYHFTNHWTDIRELFCAALDSLGIPWTPEQPLHDRGADPPVAALLPADI